MRSVATVSRASVTAGILAATLVALVANQETQPRFGGSYSALDERRQHLVGDWVARFS